MSRPTFRPSRPGDFDFCARLYFEGMAQSIKDLNLDMNAQVTGFRERWKVTQVRIITLDGTDVGWLQCFDREDSVFLGQLFVDGVFRRRGIGTAAVKALIGEATSAGRAVTLGVVKTNPAVRLYERLGFRTTHEDARELHMRRDLLVRRLETADADDYRELRLESLRDHPESFSTSWEQEADKPRSWWTGRLQTSTVFGGWMHNSRLVGIAGLRVQDGAKLRHKGTLVGMYVRPEARGTGLSAALVRHVIEHARTVVEEVCLGVGTFNVGARRLYDEVGFREYGIERRALKVGNEFYDEALMALPLAPRPPGPSVDVI